VQTYLFANFFYLKLLLWQM